MSARGETSTLLERLRRHYIKPGPMPGGVFIPECGINGGAQTRADALYVGFTSTSGRILIGHELKVSRADWRKELDTAGKADFWADNCHAWYVVAPGPEVVPKDEVPHGWGLLYPSGRTKTRMDIIIKAPVTADRQPSWNATRSILARLDTLQAQHDHQVLEQAVTAAREEAARQADLAQRRSERAALTPETEDRLASLDRLENLLGERLTAWFDGDHGVTPELAVAALRLAEARHRITGRGNRDVQARWLREAAEQVLKGLGDFTAAMTELQQLERTP